MKRFILVILLVLLSSVHTLAQENETTRNMLNQLKPKIVRIDAINNQVETGVWGTGLIVSYDGLIYTNRHVVVDGETGIMREDFMISIAEGRGDEPTPRYYAKVVSISNNEAVDFAILQIDRDGSGTAIDPLILNLPYVDTGNEVSVEENEAVTLLGYPPFAEGGYRTINGVVTGIIEETFFDESLPYYYAVDTEGTQVSSGGTAVDAQGNVLGLTTLIGSTNEMRILTFDVIRSLIENNRPNNPTLVYPRSVTVARDTDVVSLGDIPLSDGTVIEDAIGIFTTIRVTGYKGSSLNVAFVFNNTNGSPISLSNLDNLININNTSTLYAQISPAYDDTEASIQQIVSRQNFPNGRVPAVGELHLYVYEQDITRPIVSQSTPFVIENLTPEARPLRIEILAVEEVNTTFANLPGLRVHLRLQSSEPKAVVSGIGIRKPDGVTPIIGIDSRVGCNVDPENGLFAVSDNQFKTLSPSSVWEFTLDIPYACFPEDEQSGTVVAYAGFEDGSGPPAEIAVQSFSFEQ